MVRYMHCCEPETCRRSVTDLARWAIWSGRFSPSACRYLAKLLELLPLAKAVRIVTPRRNAQLRDGSYIRIPTHLQVHLVTSVPTRTWHVPTLYLILGLQYYPLTPLPRHAPRPVRWTTLPEPYDLDGRYYRVYALEDPQP